MLVNATETEPVMRLFTAVPLSEEARGAISSWTDGLKKQMSFRKWVHPQDYHITLQFLGDTEAGRVESVITALRRAAAGQSAVELTLHGAGVFGQPSAPRILWTGIDGELEKLHGLYKRITAAMSPLGFPPEDRPYRPHITAARKFTEGHISDGLLRKGPESVSWKADSIVLYRTNMHASPMYEIQEQIKLGN